MEKRYPPFMSPKLDSETTQSPFLNVRKLSLA
jgi:hypothetical protein